MRAAKAFQYRVGDLVVHKHWHIVGKVYTRSMHTDAIGQEFHAYEVKFDFDSENPMSRFYMRRFTEFELSPLPIQLPK